jgi:hypothetical protein
MLMAKNIRNRVMVLIPTKEYATLISVGYQNTVPIVKLFMGNLTWLVTCIEGGILYGYADLGMGVVEFGSLCHESDLPALKVGFAYLERDRRWKPVPNAQYLLLDSLCGV